MLKINLKPGLFFLCFLLIIISCKKNNDNKENAFIVNEIQFSTPNGFLEIYSPEEDGGDFDITLADSEHSLDSIDYSLNSLVYFDFKSPSTTELSLGEYNYNNDWPPYSFDYGFVVMYGYNGVVFDITDGTVTIGKSGDSYEIEYDLTIGSNTNVSGYYKGTLQEIDQTQ